jgi:hypothetical protein
MDELSRILYEISSKTRKAVENIELGMLRNEVERFAGKPRLSVTTSSGYALNYGKV